METTTKNKLLTTRKKSVRLAPGELTELKRIGREFYTAVELCHFFNLTPSTLNRAIHFGSASPETVTAIKTGIDRYHKEKNCLTA